MQLQRKGSEVKHFLQEHKAHLVVLISLAGHQLTMTLISVDAGEHYYFVLEVCRIIFLGG